MLLTIFAGARRPLEITQARSNKGLEGSRRAFGRLWDGRSSKRFFHQEYLAKALRVKNRPILVGKSISHSKVLEKLGEGGMGEVWLAKDTKLERRVALKFLASHLVSDPESHKRFQRKAKAAAGLSHSNVCTVYEIDEVDGKPFLAAEYIEGESLEAKIEQGR